MNGEIPTTKFSLIQSLFSLPLYVIGKWFGDVKAVTAYFNCVVFIVTLFFAWLVLPKNKRFVFILLLMCASMFPNQLREYYGETLSVCLYFIGFLLLERGAILWGGILLGLGAAQIPATIPAYCIALLYCSIKTKRPRLTILIAIPIVLAIFENWLKFGSLFGSPYLRANEHGIQTILPYSGISGFSYPILLGVISILFSFGKGLLFFVPSLFLADPNSKEKHSNDDPQILINTFLIFVCVLVLTYSKWWAWYGGSTWGPRFFLIASVASSLIFTYHFFSTSTWQRRVLFCVVLIYSGWVCIQGYLYGTSHLGQCNDNNYALELLCWYVPEFSPIFREFVLGKAAFFETQPLRIAYAMWCVASVFYILLFGVFSARQSHLVEISKKLA